MSMPKSVTKINKDGILYTSSVDATQYTIEELSRAALRDVARLVRKEAKQRAPKDTGNLRKNIATWVKKSRTGELPELQVGVYNYKTAKKKGLNSAFYGMFFEFGTIKLTKQPFLKPAVYDNISKIKEIESQYLSGVPNITIGTMFDESEEISDD